VLGSEEGKVVVIGLFVYAAEERSLAPGPNFEFLICQLERI
jgi:hypothetical protein